MIGWVRRLSGLAVAVACWPTLPGRAATPDSLACSAAVAEASRSFSLPNGLLAAIAAVESGRPDPASGQRTPWPWTVNAEGAGHFYGTEEEAVAAVQAFQRRGVASIDVGCLQVNLGYHPDAFATLADAFDPAVNARYASLFLSQLFAEQADWLKAAAAYHSHTPELATPYETAVAAAWHDGAGLPPTVFGLPVLPDPAPAKSAVPLPVAVQTRVTGVSFATGQLDNTWVPVPLPPPHRRPHPRGRRVGR